MNWLLQDSATRRTITGLLLTTGGVLTMVRLVLVIVWCIVLEHDYRESIQVEILESILAGLILLCIAGISALYFMPKMGTSQAEESVWSSLATYVVSTMTLLVLGTVLPLTIEDSTPQDIGSAVSLHVVAIGLFAVSFGLAGYLFSVISVGRTRRAKAIQLALAAHIIVIWFCTLLREQYAWLNVVDGLLVVSGCIVMLIGIRRQRWLLAVPTGKKVRLLWLTLIGCFSTFWLFAILFFWEEAAPTLSAELFMRDGAIIPSILNLFGFVYFVRLLLAIVASLPNSGIVSRRANEIESLTRLNRLMLDLTNTDQLMATVTRSALEVCHAHGAWVELYGPNSIVTIKGNQPVVADFVSELHAQYGLREVAQSSSIPFLIPSVEDHYGRKHALPTIGSIAFVPLSDDGKRTGTLVVFATEEYGLDNDDLQLLSAFGDQILISMEQQRLQKESVSTERMKQEFRVARNIQLSLLPQHSPLWDTLDVHSIMLPALEVGGDYYDYVHFKRGTAGIIIADVSGKGIPAALYMATLKGAVLSAMRDAEGPADLLCRLNATLFGSMQKGMYITVACVEIDEQHRTLRLARAGHTPAMVVRGNNVMMLQPAGMAIGMAPPELFESVLEERTIETLPGDVVLLTTDGVNERRNGLLAELGMESIVAMFETSHRFRSAADVVESTMRILHEHGESADAHDDITIVAIRFRENQFEESLA